MASVDELRPIPPPWTNISPSAGGTPVGIVAGVDMLRGRYETMFLR